MHIAFAKRFLYCLVIIICSYPGIVLAGQLQMKNGDRITGSIIKIDAKKITIKPEYAGEFSVKIEEVASVEAEKEFAVKLHDGSGFNARFDVGDGGEQFLVVDGESKSFMLTEIEEAQEPADYYERVSQVDVNLTANGGNTDSQNTLLFADTRLRLGDHRHLVELTFRRDETDGESTKEQDLLNYQYNWIFREPWYMGATATYERDPIRDLSHRYTLGALMGRDVISSANEMLAISFGVGFSDETIGGVSDSGAVGLWNLRYTRDLWGGDIALVHNHDLSHQFYGAKNTIFKSTSGLQVDVMEDIYAKISLRYDYETDPAEGVSNDDTTLALGVGTKF